MNGERLKELRSKAALFDQKLLKQIRCVPVKVRILLGLFLLAALAMAIHTALTSNDASLHLKLQHSFRSAEVSVWVDHDLAYSGKITGAAKKKFGLIPTDAQQGSLSQVIPLRSGQRNIRVRVQPDDAAMQEDSITGTFASNAQRDLSVNARRNGMSVSWQGSSGAPVEAVSSFAWLSRYASSLFLTITGSIMSALAGYAIRELPARLRSSPDSAPKV